MDRGSVYHTKMNRAIAVIDNRIKYLKKNGTSLGDAVLNMIVVDELQCLKTQINKVS